MNIDREASTGHILIYWHLINSYDKRKSNVQLGHIFFLKFLHYFIF